MNFLSKTSVLVLGLASGYGLSQLQVHTVRPALAQEQEAAADLSVPPTEDTVKKIVAANDALRTAVEALKLEQRYAPATQEVNPYAVLIGGINAVEDLESGRGVDPFTFTGLYAGNATPAVAEHLGRDEDGRLTYKNRVVRLYPVARLKKLEATRLSMTGGTRPAEAAAQ